jgi:Membrane domain of glycerophosphoryl diester phosphodiesterase
MAATELRPLSLGELLDHTFSYYRKHFLLFVGIMALPQVLIVATSLVLLPFQTTRPGSTPPQDPRMAANQIFSTLPTLMITFGVIMMAYALVYCIALGATTVALSEVHLGRETTIAGAYRSLRGKVLRLFDVVISIIIRCFGIYLLVFLSAIAIVVVPLAFLGVQGKPNPLLLVGIGLLMIFAMVGGAVLAIFLIMRYTMAVPALVLENLKARDAIKRSVALAKGNLWRIFLTVVLMYFINMVVVGVFQGPFWLVMLVAAAKTQAVPAWIAIPMNISAGIGGALSGPLMIIALALQYYDARVRKEGYDLQLMMASLDNASGDRSMPPPAVSPAPFGN